MIRPRVWFLLIVVVTAAIGAACGGSAAGPTPMARTMAGESEPVDLAELPEAVAARYRFAEANRTVMEGIPCYCGCASLDHRSLYDCFVRPQGGYEAHGAGCGICQAEAIDVERMLGEGRDLAAIRAAIDSTYAASGPATNTP